MRTIISVFIFFFFIVILSAQVPQGINYQAVMRDELGNPISMPLSILIEIFSNSMGSGVPDFSEVHSVSPEAETGLFNITIGKNNPIDFAAIDWASGSKYIKTTINGIPGPITEMVSVPYALFAQNAANSGVEYNAGEGILIEDNTIVNQGDLSNTNEIQQLTLNGNTLTLSNNGGTVYLSSLTIDGQVNYVAKFTPDGTNIGNSVIFDDGTNVGIGNINPNDKLDVEGNTQVSGYLKVGNPSEPSSSPSYSNIPLYKLSYLSGTEAWTVDSDCGTGDYPYTQWFVDGFGNDSGLLYYQSQGSYNRSYAYSPWVWAPSISSTLLVEGTFYCDLQNNYDGVFLEYRIGEGEWTKINSFTFGEYPDNAYGCDTTCSSSDYQACWNGIYDTWFFRVAYSEFPPEVFGNWIRFRFVGMESSSTGSSTFELYGFNVVARGVGIVGGQFSEGNIYAEKNIFAGSNVLLGDVAEYFIVEEETEPGDLIAISSKESNSYTICEKENNPFILGVHSSNPTITLNAPNGVPVSLTGRVPVKVCGENGPIKIGDYLTSSSMRGYVMRADKPCFIVGRALEKFNSIGTGKILCIVEPGWYNPRTNSNNPSGGGSFFVSKGSNSVKVKDASVKPDSRIFITLRGNAGNYWVSNVSDGMFILDFEKDQGKDIPFDYFIHDANSDEKIEKSRGSYGAKKGNEIRESLNKDLSKRIQLQQNSNEIPPNSPPDIKSGWTWSKKTGFIKTKVAQK